MSLARLLALVLPIAGAVAADVSVDRPLWDARPDSGWMIWWPTEAGPCPATIEADGESIVVRVPEGAAERSFPLFAPKLKQAAALGAVGNVAMEVELAAGAASLALNVTDAAGESFHLRDRQLVAGRQRIAWDLATDRQHAWGEHRDGKLDQPLALWDLVLAVPAGARCEIRMRPATTSETKRAVDCLRARLETGSPVNVIDPAKAGGLSLRVANTAAAALAAHVAVTLTAFDGTALAAEADVTVPPGGEVAGPRLPRPDRLGWWRVAWTIRCDGGEDGDDADLALLTPTAAAQGPFRFAVCGGIDPGNPAQMERTRAVLAAVGANNLRTSFDWNRVETVEGRWDEAYTAAMRDALAGLARDGVGCELLLAYTAKWAAPAETRDAADMTTWLFAPPRLDAWRAYVRRTATAMGDAVPYYEAWNEADIREFWPGPTDAYLELLRATREELKGAAPKARLLTCGFATLRPHGGRKDPKVMERVVGEARDAFDILAFHEHGLSRDFRAVLDGELARVRALAKPAAPLWLNETAVNLETAGERGQAVELVKKLTLAWSRGAIGYTWYNLIGGLHRWVPGGDRNWGLVCEDWHPRPALAAYATLVRRLGTATAAAPLAEDGIRTVIRCADGDHAEVCAWDDRRGLRTALVFAAAGDADAVDLMGNRLDVQPTGGLVAVPVGADPCYARLAATAKPRESIIAIGEPPMALPGEPAALTVRVANPFADARTVTIAWQAAAELGGGEGTLEAALPAGGTADLTVPLTLPATTRSRPGTRADVTLRWSVSGTPWKGSLAAPVTLGGAIGGASGRPADIELAARDLVNDLNANVPQRERLLWTGPEDCSAEAWFDVVDDALVARVTVRDDVQRNAAADDGALWQGDSVQVALALPGQRGHWEFGLRLRPDGTTGAACWIRPDGRVDPLARCVVQATREGTRTGYRLTVPLAALGVDAAALRGGFGLDLAVNDDDGEGRERWLQLTPGIADRKDANAFARFRLVP